MRTYLPLTLLLCIAFLAPLIIGAAEPDPNEKDCAILLATRCDECHYRTRICYLLGKKSKRQWHRIINNMMDYGVKISEEQREILTDCLYKAPPNADFVCQQPKPKDDTK